MNISCSDRCAHTGRWAGQHPAERLVPALAALTLVLVVPAGPGHLAVALLAMLLTWISGVRLADYLRIAAGPLLFLAAAVLPLLVTVSLAWPPQSAWAVGGQVLALEVGSRACAGMAILIFVACTVPMASVVAVLRACRCPAVVADLMLLIYRQVFVLAETLEQSGVAAEVRGGSLSWKARWRSTGARIATLARRSWDRSSRWEIGLRARCWEGDLRLVSRRAPRPGRIAGWTLAMATVVLMTLWGAGSWRS